MEVGGPLTLAEVLQRLAQQVDGFPTLPLEVGRLQAEVLIYDGARFLRPGDTVRPGTILELLPPTAGG